jgi:predicted transcriptional regulator
MLSGPAITDVIECLAMKPGILIRNRRNELGLSQEGLGKLIGATQITVQKIESGKTKKASFSRILVKP